MKKPVNREMNQEEMREKLFQTIWSLINFWVERKEAVTYQAKLAGFAHSMLVLFDGFAPQMTPAFKLVTKTNKGIEAERRETQQNWWPDGVDLGNDLHDEFFTHEHSDSFTDKKVSIRKTRFRIAEGQCSSCLAFNGFRATCKGCGKEMKEPEEETFVMPLRCTVRLENKQLYQRAKRELLRRILKTVEVDDFDDVLSFDIEFEGTDISDEEG